MKERGLMSLGPPRAGELVELCRRRPTAAVDREAETCGGDEGAAVLLVPCGEARFERAKLDPATRWADSDGEGIIS